MNSEWNPSLYEVWRQKIAEDNEEQTVRRVHWDSKVPGICVGTKAAATPGVAPTTGYGEESYITSSFPYQSKEGSLAPGGTWMLEVAGGNRDQVGDTQRQYTSTGTMDAGTREVEVPGNTWRREELGFVRL